MCVSKDNLRPSHGMLSHNFQNEKVTTWQCLRIQELLRQIYFHGSKGSFIYKKNPSFGSNLNQINSVHILKMGWDSIVSIATLHARRFKVQIPVGLRLSAHIQTSPVAHPASYTMGTRSFPGVMRMGRGIDYPPPPSTEVKERIQLYIYSPFGLSWVVLGWSLPLPSHTISPTGSSQYYPKL